MGNVQQYSDEEKTYCRICGNPCHEGYEVTYFARDTEGRITDTVLTCTECDCAD